MKIARCDLNPGEISNEKISTIKLKLVAQNLTDIQLPRDQQSLP